MAVVHPVLTGSAVLKLYRSGLEAVLATDTLDKGASAVSVVLLIAEAIKDLWAAFAAELSFDLDLSARSEKRWP